MGEYTQEIPLINDRGSVNFGWSRQPLFNLNMKSASSVRRHPFGAWRLKRWEYFYVVTPTVFFAAQIAHIGYLANLVAYLYDFEHNALLERTSNIPFGTGVSLADHPRMGTTCATGGTSGTLRSEMTVNGKHFVVDWPRFNGPYDLHADLLFRWPDELESLNVVDPLKDERFAYTTKVMCMPATGAIHIGRDVWECRQAEALGTLDWSRGFLEAVTQWKWATASGRDQQGNVVGFNLCSGFHDGGDNENAIVCNGRLTKLGAVSFTYDQTHVLQPWRIESPDGCIDLTFVPLTDRQAYTDAGLLQSHIHQLVGKYSGRLCPSGSEPLVIQDVVGAAEDHYARW